MPVYIESLVCENLVMDYLIGALSYRFLRLSQDGVRLFFCAVAGAAFAVLFPLLPDHYALLAAYKLLTGALLAAILYAKKYRFFRGLIALWCAAFLFGGCLFALRLLCFRSVLEAFTRPLPFFVWLAVVAMLVFYRMLRRFLCTLGRRATIEAHSYRYSFTLEGRTVTGQGFLDTGNGLYDLTSGLPVVVVHLRAILPILSEEEALLVCTGHADRVFGARRMACRTLGGAASLWLVRPQTFAVYFGEDGHIVKDVMVGLSFSAPTNREGYDAILHPSLIENTLA